MALVPLRPAHRARAELDRQPVDQPRQLPVAGRLLDQAFLRGAEILGPGGLEREGVEAELGVERSRFIREQAAEMLRLAARIVVATDATATLPSMR